MPDWLLDVFSRYGYGAVFVGVLLENAGVPVPGETIVLAGGALAQLGSLSLPLVMAMACAGAILGDNLGFLVGRRGGRVLAERHGSWVGLTPARLATLDRFFDRHGPQTIFIARFVTGLRVFAALLAGASGLRWSTFLVYNASGAIVWSVVIATVGYALAHSWEKLVQWVGAAGTTALIVCLVLLGWGWMRGRRTSKSPTTS